MSGDFQIGEWSVQPAVNRLKRGNQVVRVEPKVMQVLVCLAENAGEVVTRERLIATVWADVFVTDDVLHRAIRELRRVFGDSTSAPTYIETIRKRGYRLLPPSTPAREESQDRPAGTVPEAGTVPGTGDSPRLDPQPGRAKSATFSLVAAAVATAVIATLAMLATRANDLVPQAHARFVPIVSGPLNESDPAISADGQRIAFVQREAGALGSADIYIRNLADGSVTRLTDNAASDRMPAWSPDGLRLAFVRATHDTCDIVTRSIATMVETRVAPCPNANDPKLTWTRDGQALLTSAAPLASRGGWQIARVDVATGGTSALSAPPQGIVGDHSPAVSPDGRQIAFIRRTSGGVSDIYVSAIDGRDVRRVTFDDADLTGLDWTADGRSLVYSSDRAGGYSLWRVRIDGGGSPTLLAGGAARMKHPVADPATRRVIYENWNYEINLWQTATATVGETPVTRTSELWNLYPQVSPDNLRIAYVSTQSGSHQLWVADRSGTNPRQLTHVDGGIVKTPRWSPDGRRIVYLARGRGSVDVQQIDLATGTVSHVTTTTASEMAPAWSHDGTRIVYSAPDDHGRWHVWSVNAADGRDVRREIANAVAAQPAPEPNAWYYTRTDESGLWRSGPTGTTERVLNDIDAGNTLGWTISNNAIYYVVDRDDRVILRRASLRGDGSADVATLTQFTWPGFSVAADGTVFYARWDRRDSNLMSIEY
jgi:Tol biopolymer transport system component/DNA-binding winged helix-turn-helix (wHTH) protein